MDRQGLLNGERLRLCRWSLSSNRDDDRSRRAAIDWRGLVRGHGADHLPRRPGAEARLARKFAAVFVAFGGYTLIWGWKFALGVIVLIFVHEMGHFLEASRERLHPSWPVFIPFLGAYVKHTRGNPWQTARVAIAGPILGGLAALACYLVGTR